MGRRRYGSYTNSNGRRINGTFYTWKELKARREALTLAREELKKAEDLLDIAFYTTYTDRRGNNPNKPFNIHYHKYATVEDMIKASSVYFSYTAGRYVADIDEDGDITNIRYGD